MAAFVLEPFEPDELDVVRPMILRAADAVETVLRSGWNIAMNEFNRSLPGREAEPED
jgi:peptidyl-tRNA hydrolase